MNNEISTEKRLYCLKWDLLNIEDLNEKREYLANRVFEIEQSLVSKNESLHLVSNCTNNCLISHITNQCEKCGKVLKEDYR